MLLLRIFLSLMLALNINTSIAADSLEGSAAYQEKLPIVIAKRKDARQRGECGTPPHTWALDLCQSHKFCYVAPSEVSLWVEKRPKGSAKVLLENSDTADSVELTWKKTDATFDWPEESVPIHSGAFYQVKIWKREFLFEKEISLHQIPPALKTLAEKMEWMTLNGCESQVEVSTN